MWQVYSDRAFLLLTTCRSNRKQQSLIGWTWTFGNRNLSGIRA